jgi:drug/metabolite transporter (DMT)-like permease
LLLGVGLVAVSYAEGGRLSTELDGFAVICWALVLSLPLTILCIAASVWQRGLPTPSGTALGCFAYVSLVSMLFGFCAWYRGLALGGIARGSQVQLLQPVLSLAWCALLLAEPLSSGTLLTGTAVLASAAGARLVR